MPPTDYHEKIIQYYNETENSYKDSWDLNNSLALHYGYWDKAVKSFRKSLTRMNEVMMIAAEIKPTDWVLDAGCGVGGSSIFLSSMLGCRVTGITLSERQVKLAIENAGKNESIDGLVDFKIMNYSSTDFPAASFDVVWGIESICHADNKELFIKEAFRILKPGGRLVIADGFVSDFKYNNNPIIRQWLDGWYVNYLETPQRFESFMEQSGFSTINYRNISNEIAHSSRRLYKIYFLAKLYRAWKKISFSKQTTAMQNKNINACKYQYLGMKNGLWQYGLIVGSKQ